MEKRNGNGRNDGGLNEGGRRNGRKVIEDVNSLAPRSKEIYLYVKGQMGGLFKTVLSDIEAEARTAGIKDEFFAKNGGGFHKIRKNIFERGNHILNFLYLVLEKVAEIRTKDEIINLKK